MHFCNSFTGITHSLNTFLVHVFLLVLQVIVVERSEEINTANSYTYIYICILLSVIIRKHPSTARLCNVNISNRSNHNCKSSRLVFSHLAIYQYMTMEELHIVIDGWIYIYKKHNSATSRYSYSETRNRGLVRA